MSWEIYNIPNGCFIIPHRFGTGGAQEVMRKLLDPFSLIPVVHYQHYDEAFYSERPPGTATFIYPFDYDSVASQWNEGGYLYVNHPYGLLTVFREFILISAGVEIPSIFPGASGWLGEFGCLVYELTHDGSYRAQVISRWQEVLHFAAVLGSNQIILAQDTALEKAGYREEKAPYQELPLAEFLASWGEPYKDFKSLDRLEDCFRRTPYLVLEKMRWL